MKALVISLGGTINQRAAAGGMAVEMDLIQFEKAAGDVALQFVELSRRAGANLQIADIFKIKELIEKNRAEQDGFLILTGTDSMEEIGYGLDLVLDMDKPVVITAAMRPADALGYDGIRNFRDSIEVMKHESAPRNGVLAVISEEIHAARYLRKRDSQALNAFDSGNGPMGRIRRGIPRFHYEGMPPVRKFTTLSGGFCDYHVPIVPIYLGCKLNARDFEKCHGLVLAGMGTGSLPDEVAAELAKGLTSKIPVCITSRCLNGGNYDDFYYKGSLVKYESRGFLLEGYEELSPYQARIRLIFELAEKARRS